MKQLGPMVMMRGAEGTPKSPAPTLGQHTEEILGGLNGAVISNRKQGVHDIPKYPLDGITVLDLTTFINGPLAASLLTELGARVIRIETLEGDWLRHNWYGLCVHRTMAGTESLSLDLKTPEGKKVLEQLIAKTDILLHNMRPGAPERLGFGYDQALKINPRLVYVYAAGYGSTGPHSHRPSMHPVPGAVCGGALAQLGRDILPPSEEHMTVDEINEVSWRLGRANDGTADQNSTMAVSVAMLLGLYAREKTGNPQYLESTLLGGNAYANAEDFFWHEGKAPRLIPDSDGYGLHALYRLYQAQTGWVFLACPFEKEWRAFCETVGRSDLIEDKRFADSKDREHNDAALAEEIGRVFETQDAVYWEKLLTAADVACVQAEDRGMYQFFNDDPHVLENGFITHVETLRLGKFWRHSPILHFSHTESRTGVGPLKGEHTRTILEELGYSDVTILDFKERGLVDWEEP
jgi:crotonobetainyl-CoA:carnitine CoA-transferase CaiB-like acyl-CoA transferase